MRLSSIPQIYRHFHRWREILRVLSKYGLAEGLSRLGPEFAKDLIKTPAGDVIARLPFETRVRLALVELGPSFVKLGQALSTRPDVVGPALAAELQALQEHAPADPPDTVAAILRQELGRPWEEVFARFDFEPLASASIGQVHRACLRDGSPVAVKVQHPDIERKLEVDLEIVLGLAQWAEKVPELADYRPRAIASEFQRTVRRELDFRREVRHMQEFARQFAGNPAVHIPRVYPEYSSRRVLTMEFVEGIKLADTQRLAAAGIDLEEVARRGADMYMAMIFTHGYYHADPHPGNLVLMEGNVIGLLDFGMVGRIDERLQEDLAEMLLAVANEDAEHLASVIIRVGAVPPDLDRASLSVDLADFLAHYATQSLADFDLSAALNELVEIIRRYHVVLPARLALLLKMLITLDGTGKLLSPRFSLMEVMQPYHRKLLWQRLSPRRHARRMRRWYYEIRHLLESLPGGLVEILEQIQSGKFDVHLDHRGLEPSVNRLVLGLLTSALFVGSAMLVASHVQPLIYGVSVPGAAGCFVALLLGFRVWRAISRSIGRRR